MKRNIYKKRLMKNTTSVMSILVAVILIFTSATAVNSNNDQEEMNIEETLFEEPLFATARDSQTNQVSALKRVSSTAPIIFEDWLHYDDGTCENALGLTAGGELEEAIRLTPTELAGYDGYEIQKVRVMHGWPTGTPQPSHNAFVRIYEQGTATAPGPLAKEQAFVAPAGNDWVEVDLVDPYVIDETEDVWVSVAFTHAAGEFPCGFDTNTVEPGKGGFFTYPGAGAWLELQNSGFPGVWNLRAGVEMGGPAEEHDVALVSINSPEDGPAGVITPEVTVKNKGNNTETNVPVDMEIYKILPSTTVLSEGFENAIPGYLVFPPLGWTIESTSTSTWFKYSTGYARCSEDNTGAQDEWLITETFDCSALTSVVTSMYFYMATPNDDYVEILGSTDDGVTWPNMIANINGYMGSALRSYDITSWAAGQSLVKIAWRWVSSDALTGSDYFYFRQFKISSPAYAVSGVDEDFNGVWGPWGDNPPADWTILDFGSVPGVWNANDWHKYYYSTFASDCARVYYSPYESMDEWLITPTIDCSALTDVGLRFRQYLYFYATYPGYGIIEGSTDDGTTWTESIAYYDVTQASGYYSFDLSSWAAGESLVKIRFRYHAPSTQGRYWYLDDIMAGSIVDEVILFENYWFIDWMPTDWGPNGWMEEEVTGTTDYDPNVWRAADNTYLTNPSVDPYAGDYMAIYDTGLLYPNGASCRLYTPAMDWSASGATVLTLKFMIHISNYGSTYTDHCDVQVSTDGSTWDTLESINTYDSSNPGWVEKVVDITSYASETTARLGFLAVDGGYRDIIIDDISIEASPTLLDYDETAVIPSIAPDESIDVEFDAWTPDDWQVSENVDISYMLTATTLLPGDENPDNDDKEGFATLSYPYLHDIAVTSISDPTSGTAQTLPVEATIKNVGQFSECCYATSVQIGYYEYDINGFFSNFEANDGGYTVSGGLWEWGTPTGAGPGGAYSGTKLWATSLAAGYPSNSNAKLDSVPITVPVDGNLIFWHWYDIEASYDGYNVKISTDSGATWTVITPIGGYTGTANTANPLYPEPIFCGHVQMYWEEETFDLSAYEGLEVIFRWHFGSDGSVQYPGVYIDDVLVGDVTVTLIPEYDEEICTIVLDPGEEVDLTFPDWTPDALALGVSGSISYGVMAEQELTIDTNPANDQMTVDITLDYWHDIGVKEVTQPSTTRQRGILLEEGFEDTGLPSGWLNVDYDGDTYIWDCDWIYPYSGAECAASASYINPPGPGAITPDNWLITSAIDLSDQAAAELSYWVAAQDPLYPSDHLEVWISTTGTTVPGDFTDQVDDYTETNDIWKERIVDLTAYAGDTIYIAFRHCESYDWYWIKIDDVKVTGMGGVPPPDVYIAPGSQAFVAVMENLGVFLETDLDANAKLYAFNETGVPYIIHEENYTEFDLEPLGGEETATFGSYNFVGHGVYQLDIDLPLLLDDIPANNFESIGIAVDDTPPTSTHTVIPATPDGENGWYISPVTVEFEANDGTEDWQSGVDYIEYRVDGGSWQTGDSVTVTTDGEHTVEYRAVDNVGNEETPNSVAFKIDQTVPTVDLTWEATGSGTNWQIKFTATCNDATSSMNRVEFFIGIEYQFTDSEEPFEWTIGWSNAFKGVTFYSYAYDDAGNENVDEVEGEGIEAVPVPHTTPTPVVRQIRQTNPL